jgi:outer membrane protein TolC
LKENGLLSQNDYLKAQLQVSKIELSLLDVDNQHQMAQYQLNSLTGLEETLRFTVDSTIFHQNHLISDVSTFEQVETDRKDLQALIHQKEAANYLIKLQKNVYYPHINLTGTYLSMNVPNTFSVYNMLNAGVSLSYDLSAFYKKNPTIAKAKQQFLQVDEQTKLLTEKIKIELHQAFLDYQKATRQVEVYKKTVLQANENYNNIKSKHDNNLATTTDLLDADLELLQAKINQQLAQADVFLAYCNYLKTTGNLDELRKIN